MDFTEKMIASRTVMKGNLLQFKIDTVLLPNGKEATREWVQHPGAVAVVAVDDQNRICMVRQYRYPLGQELLEIPAGKIDQAEDPLDCAKRELKEEAGLSAASWSLMHSYYTTPGFSDEIIHLYHASGLTAGANQPDEDEFLEMVMLPCAEAIDMLQAGKIKDSKTIIALLSVFGGEIR